MIDIIICFKSFALKIKLILESFFKYIILQEIDRKEILNDR